MPTSPTPEERTDSSKRIVVFTCTFFKSVDDVRCGCCLTFLRLARENGLWVVVVDASPDSSGVREAFAEAGGDRVVVAKQTAKGKKGAALREAASLAAGLDGVDPATTWLCWQEPEKADMARHWSSLLPSGTAVDVVVPARDTRLFKVRYCHLFSFGAFESCLLKPNPGHIPD